MQLARHEFQTRVQPATDGEEFLRQLTLDPLAEPAEAPAHCRRRDPDRLSDLPCSLAARVTVEQIEIGDRLGRSMGRPTGLSSRHVSPAVYTRSEA